MPNPALNGNFSNLMDKDSAYKELVGAMSSAGGMCSGMTRVTAGDPTKSLFFLKVSGKPPCGMPMPPGTPLAPDLVELIKAWIMAGAKND
jgi:hypothetical protein